MDVLSFFSRVYCVFAFPIWITAIPLPNSTSETNSSVMIKNISDNDSVIDNTTSMFLKTGNESTESNIFSNLDSSTTKTNNNMDIRHDESFDKKLSTKGTTQAFINSGKNISSTIKETADKSVNIALSTSVPETTGWQQSTPDDNMAARDLKPNNVYNVSFFALNINSTSNNDSVELNNTSLVTENVIRNSTTETNVSPTEENIVFQTIDSISAGAFSSDSVTRADITTTTHSDLKQSTELAQHVKIGHHHKKHKIMHHLNLVPIEDGPFGSLIWKDKKYLISVLVPIGIGIIGAGCIIGMAYIVRFCQKTEHQVQRMREALTQPKEERNDQIVLLVNSSDEDFY